MIDVVRVAEVESVEMLPGVKRRTLSCGERVMLVQFTFDEGAVVPLHQHPQEQTGYVVKGELEMKIGSETYRLKAGDSYLAPANVEHGAKVVKEAVVVDAFSPPQEDYK
ncbi:MAG: cupin domain-containing protein [Chloroflexota bacterium]|nr:cupin domain-containing protein [Chloroflexota bacterium]